MNHIRGVIFNFGPHFTGNAINCHQGSESDRPIGGSGRRGRAILGRPTNPWSRCIAFFSFRRRKGNLDERQNKSQIALTTAISNFELKPLHVPRKKRFNDRPIHISNFEPLNSGLFNSRLFLN